MSIGDLIKTKRLLLRQWTENDFSSFSIMCADEEVMEFFPATMTENESVETGRKIQSLIDERGWGFWAVEIPNQHAFIGFVGLHTPTRLLPFSPCVEIGWRLSKESWGKGYASEAAKASLNYAFTELKLDEVVSFTTATNFRSMAVMEKIGMHNTNQNFMHPEVEASLPECEHVLYKITKAEWQRNSNNR